MLEAPVLLTGCRTDGVSLVVLRFAARGGTVEKAGEPGFEPGACELLLVAPTRSRVQ